MSFTHNPKKHKSKYHIATPTGTLCKMENDIQHNFIQHQVTVEVAPDYKDMCSVCKNLSEKSNMTYGKINDLFGGEKQINHQKLFELEQ